MKLRNLFIPLAVATLAYGGASAHTILLEENFDGDYSANFPLVIDGDNLPPAANINSLFIGPNGVSQPWWPGKDSSAAKDRFIMSHSVYEPGYSGASRDFLVSCPITIPSAGFTLSFDAQSVAFRGGEHLLSDLHVFILETEPTKANLPDASQAAKVCSQVPAGADPDLTAGEFTSYELNLDPWVGKTIYIAFANLNDSKDILALDNVLVRRLDNAELNATAPEYHLNGEFPLDINLKATTDKAVGPWTLTVSAGDFQATEQGESLTPGTDVDKHYSVPLGADEIINWTACLTVSGQPDIVVSGTTTGLVFEPQRRVLLEETTGTWCGNCPMGIYNLEEMEKDPALAGKVVPVAVHVHDNSKSEPMVCQEYADALNQKAAPLFYLNRTSGMMGFNAYVDLNYNSADPNTAAAAVLAETKRLTLADVEIANVEYADGKVSVTAAVTPAVTLDGADYLLGFSLTEDNVGIEDVNALPNEHKALIQSWFQHNYLTGNNCASHANGWTDLPSLVLGVFYQHVARANDGFWGLEGSLPDTPLKGGVKVEYTHSIDVPDTYRETEYKGKTFITAPAVNPDNLNVVVYMVNVHTGEIMNVAQKPVTDAEREHRDTAWLLDYTNSVDSLPAAATAPAEYFTIDGLRVTAPAKGQLYIVRRGAEVSKIIF